MVLTFAFSRILIPCIEIGGGQLGIELMKYGKDGPPGKPAAPLAKPQPQAPASPPHAC